MNPAPTMEPLHSLTHLRDPAAPTWHLIGSVQAAYQRESDALDPSSVPRLDTMPGHGIVGDRHAGFASPRQVLVAGEPAYQQFGLAEATLRENLRIEFSTADLRSGDVLRVGPEVMLWLTFHCEPCSRLERRHAGLAKSIGWQRGMLARVLRGGSLRRGDKVRLARAVLPAVSEDWRIRVLGVSTSIPTGRYIHYRQLAEMAGVPTAYCRAFPKLLSDLPPAISSRVLAAAQPLPGPRWDGAELFDAGRDLG